MASRSIPTTGAPTRREYVRYGSAAGAGLLAGCLGDDRQAADGSTDTAHPTAGTADGSSSVTMAPMGTVEFEAVPERAYTGLPNTVDMAVAAGRAEAITAAAYPEIPADEPLFDRERAAAAVTGDAGVA